MSKSADYSAFIDKMKNQGRTVSLEGNFVVIRPAEVVSLSDIMEMQRLNKRDGLAKHIAKEGK